MPVLCRQIDQLPPIAFNRRLPHLCQIRHLHTGHIVVANANYFVFFGDGLRA